MFKTINVYDFRGEFKAMGRENQFTYEGLQVLFDYLEELEFCNDPYELDVIALCCDFAEETPKEIAKYYRIDIDGLDDDEALETVREYLENEGGLVGETDYTIVYRSF